MIKRTFLLALPLLATMTVVACNGGVMPVDSKKLLKELDGPKVMTMEETLKASAKKAEDSGDFKSAIQYYEQLLEKKPDDEDLTFSLAECLRRSGSPDKAILIYDRLVAKDPKMIAAKESKGLALIAKGDFETPTPLFESVLKDDPTRWKTLNALGILFSTRNLQTEAQQYFNEALKYHADSPSIYNNLGLSQALTRKFDDAIHSLQRASGLANTATSERKRIDLNLALVYASAGKLDDAKAIAETYLDGAALNNNLGLYAHLAKDDQMARAYLNMALMESKVYYAKAWDNLQDISANGNENTPARGSNRSKITSAKKPPSPTTKMPADLFPSVELPSTKAPDTAVPATE